jgi:hypothetical protein
MSAARKLSRLSSTVRSLIEDSVAEMPDIVLCVGDEMAVSNNVKSRKLNDLASEKMPFIRVVECVTIDDLRTP